MFTVMVNDRFTRVKSYGDFTLCDCPEQGTLFSRKSDADDRAIKANEHIALLMKHYPADARRRGFDANTAVTVKEVLFKYELVNCE